MKVISVNNLTIPGFKYYYIIKGHFLLEWAQRGSLGAHLFSFVILSVIWTNHENFIFLFFNSWIRTSASESFCHLLLCIYWIFSFFPKLSSLNFFHKDVVLSLSLNFLSFQRPINKRKQKNVSVYNDFDVKKKIKSPKKYTNDFYHIEEAYILPDLHFHK